MQQSNRHTFIHFIDSQPVAVLSLDQVRELVSVPTPAPTQPPAPDVPKVETAPTRPVPPPNVDIITDPIVLEPIAETAERKTFMGSQVGTRAGNNIYESVDGTYYIEAVENYLLPRGTNMQFDANPYPEHKQLTGNPNPYGLLGVPRRFSLPAGWHWGQFDDKAWFITTAKTDNAGPDWLSEKPAPTGAKTNGDPLLIGNLYKPQ